MQLLRWLQQTEKGYNRHRDKSDSRKQINNVNNCLEEFYIFHMPVATHLASCGNPFVVKTSKTQILWILYDLEWL